MLDVYSILSHTTAFSSLTQLPFIRRRDAEIAAERVAGVRKTLQTRSGDRACR